MNYSAIEFAVDESIARITLNRPDVLNALNVPLITELRHAIEAIRDDPRVRCLLLTGNGRGFCAGADLKQRMAGMEGQRPDVGASIETYYNPVIRGLGSLRIPIVCAVNGIAAGAGASLALACDIVVAARSASFLQAFARIGLIPDCGSTWLLPRLVGSARAKALAMLAEPVSAEQAQAWGMIWQCVDDEALADTTAKLAAYLAQQPTQAMGLLKRAMTLSSDNSLHEQLDIERDLQRVAGYTDDFVEGVSAFAEKRPAVFKGN